MNGDKPAWWPNWNGLPCVIVASGPSVATVNLELTRGKAKVVVINNNWEKAPWADLLYACDFSWWNKHKSKIKFSGLFVSQDKQAHKAFPDIHLIECKREKHNDGKLLLDEYGIVGFGTGGCGGFQALNFVAQLGANPIILAGYDMRIDLGVHWHGKHNGLGNPSKHNVKKWRENIDGVAPVLAGLGIRVINVSEVSLLKAYPKMSLGDALASVSIAE